MRLPILKLVRDVLDHLEITPSQLMPNVWQSLMLLECLGMQYLGEVLYSYYLKEHDKEKGHYQFILCKDRVPLVTCLRSNN